jgi:dynein heavy chain
MLQTEGRYAYTTPKSFLEQLQLFVRLLERQTSLLQAKIGRLENGLDRLRVASLQVDDLKEVLAVQEVELLKKTEEADRLINVVRIETEKVSKEKLLADAEEKRVAAMAIEVAQRQRECEEDLVRVSLTTTVFNKNFCKFKFFRLLVRPNQP